MKVGKEGKFAGMKTLGGEEDKVPVVSWGFKEEWILGSKRGDLVI